MNNPAQRKILALSGGVGGAKLALGLSRVMAANELTIVANTADDFEHLGLHISPDLDTVMYTLAGLNNQEQGWGLAGETWSMLAAMKQLGGETWFRLGDRDIATHLRRTELLANGKTLTEVTTELCQQLGLSQTVIICPSNPFVSVDPILKLTGVTEALKRSKAKVIANCVRYGN